MSLPDPLSGEIKRLQDHYDYRAREYGDTPAGVHWSSLESQDQRLNILAQIGPLMDTSVLDFGCGAGRLLDVLRERFAFNGQYTGYDLSEELLRLAKTRHAEAHFERRDIFVNGVGGEFDYIFISGVFGIRCENNLLFITRVLELLFPHARRGIAFNSLSNYVDYRAANQYYADPEELFRFCKENLSPTVTLRHDYEVKPGVMPFDFTMYVYRSQHSPRRKNLD